MVKKLNKDGSVSKKRGKSGPRKTLSDKEFEQVKGLILAYCTQEEIAHFLGMSVDTLVTRLKDRGICFSDLFKQKR